ncbi:hypothetical protein [Pedobacter gandavensis]|uniref:hypothetical protein n=1 Tax=Pedobacter gandavensis TaxID=2679963 RepID=UPI00292CBEE9|nr:hypothetical protein [Pedobacter gandavensis]
MEKLKLTEEQEDNLNKSLCGFVRGNKYLRSYTTDYATIIRWKGEVILVNLNLLTEEYQKKFIDGNIKGYTNGLLGKLVPRVSTFMMMNSLAPAEVAFHFQIAGIQLIKYIDVEGNKL